MARPSANLRLFVAVYPPAENVRAWQDAHAALELPPHRMVPADQVHLTVQFVGDTPVKHLDQVIESVQRSTGGLSSFHLSAQRLIGLPERGRTRLLAIETDAPPTLLELQRRLAIRLASNVSKNPSRRFRPHFTISRFRSPALLEEIQVTIANVPFEVRNIVLMRSTLEPEGAVHTEVAKAELA